jgi:hypothetical protein
MNRLQSLASITALVLITQIIACKKDNPQPSKTDLLSKSWKTTSIISNGQEVFTSFSSCQKDDLFILTKDGKYSYDEGSTKCNSSDPQVIEMGTWVFQENQTKLKTTTVSPASGEATYTIVALTLTELKLTFSFTFNGVTESFTTTYVPQ